jgi:hypothetical protein
MTMFFAQALDGPMYPGQGRLQMPHAVGHVSRRAPGRVRLWSCARMPLAPTAAVGVSRILGHEGPGILAQGWHFPGSILVFSWPALSAILMICLH